MRDGVANPSKNRAGFDVGRLVYPPEGESVGSTPTPEFSCTVNRQTDCVNRGRTTLEAQAIAGSNPAKRAANDPDLSFVNRRGVRA